MASDASQHSAAGVQAHGGASGHCQSRRREYSGCALAARIQCDLFCCRHSRSAAKAIRLMSAPAQISGMPSFLDPATVRREVLPNGFTVLIRRDTSAPVVAIVTHVKAGYFDETDDVSGIAHVLEHMFFKGTARRGV